MADHAIGGAGEIFAAFHRVGIGEIGGNAGRIGGMIVGERNRRAAGESQRSRVEDLPAEYGKRNQNDDDKDGKIRGGCA